MVVHWSNIVCLVLTVIAVCIAVCFFDEIKTFLSYVAIVNDESVPLGDRYLGVFAAGLVMFIVGGLIHIASRDARPPRH